ncbi:MAG: hypothetical protein HS115_01050 [Spirochaetales bacterium]|nr:hypothetical protein [Spirochaetales bacterium]
MKKRALLIFLVLATALRADQLFLKNGQTIEGQITAQSRTSVTIKTAGGNMTIQKAQIRRIVFGAVKDPDEEKRKKEAEERLKKLKEEREKRQKEREDGDREKDELEKKREEERQKELTQETPEPEEITLTGAIVRSAILPGWGQVYQGRGAMGGLYITSYVALLGTTGAQFARYSWLKDIYKKQNRRNFMWSPLGIDMLGGGLGLTAETFGSNNLNTLGLHYQWQTISTRQKMEATAHRTNLAASALAAFYVWNLTDVVLFSGGTDAALGILPYDDGLGFALTARF